MKFPSVATVRSSVERVHDRLPLDRVSDPALHRYLSRWQNWLAALAAVSMIAVCWPVLGQITRMPGFLLPVFAVLGCGGIALVFAGEEAVRFGWVSAVLTSGVATFVPSDQEWPIPIPLFLPLLALTFAALCTQPLRRLPVVVAATVGVFVLGMPREATVGWSFALVVVGMGVAFLRYRARSQREIAEQTEETEVLRAREAVLAERSRIARDLHDIVAHRMSMVVVMAQTAPYRLAAADEAEEVGPGAKAEFDGIADAARESLDEVRQLLGVLRPHGDDADTVALAPVQGLSDLSELIEGVQAVGVDVELTDTADHTVVAQTVGAAVYRIVQESVTNATRHAPGAAIAVRIEADPVHEGRLDVEIVNGVPTQAVGATVGGGHGILGMTERAHAVGGSLTAAARPGGGFAVRASLPVSPATRAVA
ncbi:sensor histidine kinase [Gordonia neofelifaecis]|uniref:histidine kinase n=1 Tax=Gordonia neofelifaecis NRRL B-59395 TaxID=644548 RepID=F1YEX2_9ACTN|nr:sensor histidine kinase [Gordonia neofelifaecis]EGD56955.1 histidine kinase dimerization and phosphoacceptor region [Gordonia neofelifaecis NRRL B-59395]